MLTQQNIHCPSGYNRKAYTEIEGFLSKTLAFVYEKLPYNENIPRPSLPLRQLNQMWVSTIIDKLVVLNRADISLAVGKILSGCLACSDNLPIVDERVLAEIRSLSDYLDRVANEGKLSQAAELASLLPTGSDWLEAFKGRVDRVKAEIDAALEKITLKSPLAPLLQNGPSIRLLDDEFGFYAKLGVIPTATGVLQDFNDLKTRQLRAADLYTKNRWGFGGLSLVDGCKLEEALGGIYCNNQIAQQTPTHFFTAVLPTYPGRNSVLFEFEIARDPQDHLMVVPSTGAGYHGYNSLFPVGDPNIPDKKTLEQVSINAPSAGQNGQFHPFSAATVAELTGSRKQLLLGTIGLVESTSIVLVLMPRKVEELSLTLPRASSDPLCAPATRGGGLHTSVGYGFADTKSTWGKRTVLNTQRHPTIMVFNVIASDSI